MGNYKVIFRGTLTVEMPLKEIRRRLISIYKGNEEIADRFFTGRPVLIKKNADLQQAERYKAAFEKAGVLCDVIEDRPDASSLQAPTAPPRGSSSKELRGYQTVASVNSPKEMATGKAAADGHGTRPALKGSGFQNVLAVIMILSIIGCAAIRIWAIGKSRAIYPPDHLSANGTEVCVHINGSLFFLSPEGALKRRQPLSAFGIKRAPADLQLLKSGEILIGDTERHEILRCSASQAGCRRIGPAGAYALNDNFKFLADEERNLLFISDTDNNMLLLQDLQGSRMERIEAASAIRSPNGLALDREGRLWLSNTENREVLSFELKDGKFVQNEGVIRLRPETEETRKMEEFLKQKPGAKLDLNDLLARIKEIQRMREKLGDDLVYTFPQALAWDGKNNLWVAADDRFLTRGGVRVFDSGGNRLMRVLMGKNAIPADIAGSGEKVFLTDSGDFQVYSLSAGSEVPSAFGDRGFQREVSRIRDELGFYKKVTKWAGRSIWLLAIATAVLVLFIALQKKRRPEKETRPLATAPSTEAGGNLMKYRLAFTGSGSEYFRIWIVNVLLTIVTLGIYAAWAKVRTRSYFYRNTILDRYHFDYTADPMALLKGYMIVAAGLLIYYATKYFTPAYSLIVLGVFALIIPLLVYKSLRFFARNSTYRNIRFRFLGNLGDSYRTYLLYPLLIPFTLGLIVPYWVYTRKRYFFGNFSYGAAVNSFTGTHSPFYGTFCRLVTVSFVCTWAVALPLAFIIPKLYGTPLSGKGLGTSVFVTAFVAYGFFLLAASFVQMYLYAWTTNYCLRNSELGTVRFESAITAGRLFWIRISNIAAIIFSMGLLTPWAKVRRMRYIVECISVITSSNLADFASASVADESSYGEAATEFFDFELGL